MTALLFTVEFAQLLFGLLQYCPLFPRKFPASPVNVEIEHGHGRAKGCALAPCAAVSRALERQGDLMRVMPGEDTALQIKRVARFGDLL